MKKVDSTIGLLRAVPGLSTAPRRTLAALEKLVDRADIAPGRVLIREGAVGRELFVVVDGEADVVIDGELVAVVGPGEFIGEMAMLDQRPRSATVRARTAMQVLVIGPAAFPSLVQYPQVARIVALQLSGRLRRIETKVDLDASSPHRTAHPATVGRRPL